MTNEKPKSAPPSSGSGISHLYEEWRQRYGESGKVSAEAHLGMAAVLLGCKMREVVERVNDLVEHAGTLEKEKTMALAQIQQVTQRLERMEKMLELLSHNAQALPESVVDSMILLGAKIGTSRPKEEKSNRAKDEESILP